MITDSRPEGYEHIILQFQGQSTGVELVTVTARAPEQHLVCERKSQ